ncbi:MAG TPA: YceI family protein [Polyangiaceae bacterium LLY-WYZ-15_(1-7)]|nr:YceI family protein [Polyangiaceae bacterium LLY-WYZ-15_(1-7)]
MRTTTIPTLLCALALSAACEDPSEAVPTATVNEPGTEAEANEAEASEAEASAEGAAEEQNAAREVLAFGPDGSSIGWVGSKVTGSHEGGFREFSGEIAFDPADPTRSRVSVTIDATSLFADDPDLTDHLKTGDFFETERFPQARFVTTAIAEGGEGEATHTLTGDLTLHGETKSISFPATVGVTDAAVTARAEFSINRRDFGINYDGRANDLIRDGVVIRLDLRAPRGATTVAGENPASPTEG